MSELIEDEEDEEEEEEVMMAVDEPDEIMEAMLLVEKVCGNEVPYFCFHPERDYFSGRVSGGNASALFIAAMVYFVKNQGPEIVFDDVVAFMFLIRHRDAHVVPTPVNLDGECKDRIKRMTDQCREVSKEVTDCNFFIALLTDNGCRAFTGGAKAPYNPSFHLFHRLCNSMMITFPPSYCILTEDGFYKYAGRLDDGMRVPALAWQESGKESAKEVFVKALKEVSKHFK